MRLMVEFEKEGEDYLEKKKYGRESLKLISELS